MKNLVNLVTLVLILLLTSCYRVPEVNIIESKPVLQDIVANHNYHTVCKYYVDSNLPIKVGFGFFHLEEDIDYFNQQKDIAIQKAINYHTYEIADSVIFKIYAIDKRGNLTAPTFRWRGDSGFYITERGYVYKEKLK